LLYFPNPKLTKKLADVKGITPKLLEKLIVVCGGDTIADFLYKRPLSVESRHVIEHLHPKYQGQHITIPVTIKEHHPHHAKVYKILAIDSQRQPLSLIFFAGAKKWVGRVFTLESKFYLSGILKYEYNKFSLAHPDYSSKAPSLDAKVCLPIYGLTEGLTQKMVYKARDAVFNHIDHVSPQWLFNFTYLNQEMILEGEDNYLHKAGVAHKLKLANTYLNSHYHAIREQHYPSSIDCVINPEHQAIKRLAYDELFFHQLHLKEFRKNKPLKREVVTTIKFPIDVGAVMEQWLALLPFSLTKGQQQAISKIHDNMRSGDLPMEKLLQGDVGSGKTAVAFASCLLAHVNGYQSAIMAPTDILATQHYLSLKPWCDELNIELILLKGNSSKKAQIYQAMAEQQSAIIVGTHALFQDNVLFKDLALVIVDEQHRFGVKQRRTLRNKSGEQTCHLLMMSATPIPRTMLMANYGDISVCDLPDKPAGRLDIITKMICLSSYQHTTIINDQKIFLDDAEKLANITARLKDAINNGERAYWVCPLVEDSEKMILTSVESRFKYLHGVFGDQCGIVHGKQHHHDKQAVLDKFISGDIKLLIATTVIEVGVNVPEATIIIIEHAERFGLAQLHQLRGRVGRGGSQGKCLLLYKCPFSKVAYQRLKTLCASNDGFYLAEQDLILRGSGDVVGTKQSGLPPYKCAELPTHTPLLKTAHDHAEYLLHGN
jgi:ATP-dependent DNA helicase RecG